MQRLPSPLNCDRHMATIEQSLYNIATALEVIAEELKTMNDSKPEPVTAAIREILKGGHPDWIVVPRDYIERLAKEHNIDGEVRHLDVGSSHPGAVS